MSTILAQQSLLPYWRHRAWGAIYLGVGVCTVYVHVPLVRSVNMVTHVPHVHVATHGRRNVVIFFLERSLLVWRVSRTATLRLYKKNLVLRSGAALDNNNMFTPFVAEHLNLIIQTVPVYCYEYKNGEESKSLMTGEQ